MSKEPPRQLVSAKLPPDLYDRFLEACDRIGVNKSEGIVQAIAAWLDADPKRLTVEDLVDRVTALERRLEAIEQKPRSSTRSTKVDSKLTEKTLVDDLSTSVDQVDHSSTLVDSVDQADNITAGTCPRCGSIDTRNWGRGKIRADGTRGKKIRCKSCGKDSIVG